jgi:hypothetical protein
MALAWQGGRRLRSTFCAPWPQLARSSDCCARGGGHCQHAPAVQDPWLVGDGRGDEAAALAAVDKRAWRPPPALQAKPVKPVAAEPKVKLSVRRRLELKGRACWREAAKAVRLINTRLARAARVVAPPPAPRITPGLRTLSTTDLLGRAALTRKSATKLVKPSRAAGARAAVASGKCSGKAVKRRLCVSRGSQEVPGAGD